MPLLGKQNASHGQLFLVVMLMKAEFTNRLTEEKIGKN